MKRLIIICMVLLMGCATATYQNGDVKLTVKRPIFATVSASATSSKGDIVSINAAASAQLDQLVGMALQGYSQYTSYGLASKALDTSAVKETTAIAVPKAEAQVTPPPAEVVR